MAKKNGNLQHDNERRLFEGGMDFVKICVKESKKSLDIYPDFQVHRSKDLMVRGQKFYAVWDEKAGMWSTDEYDVRRLVDEEMDEVANKFHDRDDIHIKKMRSFSSQSWTNFTMYVKKLSDNAHQLDEKLTFLSTPVRKEDYVSRSKAARPCRRGR